MIVSKTSDMVRFLRSDTSEIRLQADEYGIGVTVTDTDETVAYFSLTPSDAEILHQFLGETLPTWDKDEI